MSERGSAMLVACHDCDEVHRVPELPDGGTAVCARCGGVLFRHRAESIERALALNIAALSLFGVANLFPLMSMRLGGQAVTTTLLKGVTALYASGMVALAALVFLVAILIPLLKLVGSIWILGLARADRLTRRQAPVFRFIELLHPWGMTEVYLLGLIVAWAKLRDLASIELGLGLFAFVALILVMIWAESALEPHEVWGSRSRRRRAPHAVRSSPTRPSSPAMPVASSPGRPGPTGRTTPPASAAVRHCIIASRAVSPVPGRS